MASEKRTRKGVVAPTPWQTASTGRTVVEGDVFSSLETDASNVPPVDYTGQKLSSYPHLTHANPETRRAAHVTSVREVGVTEADGKRYIIQERYHQDNVVGAQPTHDRFLATDEHGTVYSATSAFSESARVPRKFRDSPLRKGSPVLEDERRALLVFRVGPPDDKHPPLSPRSQRRKL